jgi:hypothetical protein
LTHRYGHGAHPVRPGKSNLFAAVAPGDDVDLGVLDELLDVDRGDLVKAPISPAVEDAVPAGAIDGARSGGDSVADLGM